ncbi:hypothetical protein [Streptomyces nigrescens]
MPITDTALDPDTPTAAATEPAAAPAAHIAALRADGSGFAEATLGGIKLGLGLDAALVAVVALLVAAGLRTTRRR